MSFFPVDPYLALALYTFTNSVVTLVTGSTLINTHTHIHISAKLVGTGLPDYYKICSTRKV